MWFALKMMLQLVRLCGRARQDVILENLVLRHQLGVLERPGRRPALGNADRRLWSLLAREWSGWRAHVHIVQPATVVRWHRTA